MLFIEEKGCSLKKDCEADQWKIWLGHDKEKNKGVQGGAKCCWLLILNL